MKGRFYCLNQIENTMGNIESHVSDDPIAFEAVRAMVVESNRIMSSSNATSQSSKEVLYSYLANVIPLTLRQRKIHDVEKLVVDEGKWKALVERPLGYFICGEDPEIGLRKIKEMDHQPNICGRVFEMGDPTYSCKYVYIGTLFSHIPCCI